MKGEFSPQAFGPELAEKYRQAPWEALQDFARKVLELALKRLGGADPTPLLKEVGQALGQEREALVLAEALREYLGRRPPTRETLGKEVHLLSIGAEPLALKVGQTVLSLRPRNAPSGDPQEDVLYVGQAGEVPQRLKDLLVYRLSEGTVILAREGRRLAYLVMENP
ncbi:hypothetical protein CSW29_01890 [Thermus scotoductus]|uniref:Uncharacterized protein n=1 Tax=Thermus scotoductus TaxID=37636 RepID=A0A430UJ66_THESC|nr:hypothetical protein [Thermus scotoductus]RTI02771.1 hypothetical protein CSW29_01890 [Thermus scotoductus]